MAVLAAMDLGERSKRVLERAAAVARALGTTVLAVHVIPGRLPVGGGVGTYSCGEDLVAEMRDQAEREIAAAVAALEPGRRVPVEIEVLEGEPAPAIVARADEAGAELIVIGAHARELPTGRLGSVTSRIVRRAPCDVLVVRERRRRDAKGGPP